MQRLARFYYLIDRLDPLASFSCSDVCSKLLKGGIVSRCALVFHQVMRTVYTQFGPPAF
jgi:hypothetical protein